MFSLLQELVVVLQTPDINLHTAPSVPCELYKIYCTQSDRPGTHIQHTETSNRTTCAVAANVRVRQPVIQHLRWRWLRTTVIIFLVTLRTLTCFSFPSHAQQTNTPPTNLIADVRRRLSTTLDLHPRHEEYPQRCPVSNSPRSGSRTAGYHVGTLHTSIHSRRRCYRG